MVRKTKKELILSEVMGEYLADSQLVHMTPGEMAFVKVPISNTSRDAQAYRVVIEDPDTVFDLPLPEVRLVHAPHELEMWVKKGKVKRPPSYDRCITGPTDVMLGAGQDVELLFICQTFRDIKQGAKEATRDTFVQRHVRIAVHCGPVVEKSVECSLVPVMPPIDHTFRFYEPEHSYFKVKVPPFLQFNQAKMGLRVSHHMAHVEIN